MEQRCPTSNYLGIARLPNYRWIINDRGYANVVQISSPAHNTSTDLPISDVVYGLVYSLQPSDEERLDINEGVPYAYTKEDLSVDFWRSEGKDTTDVNTKPEAVKMLVYIDRERTTHSTPKREYIYRMNMGIKDALAMGVPEEYVEKVLQEFIPDVNDKEVETLARKQALDFEDER